MCKTPTIPTYAWAKILWTSEPVSDVFIRVHARHPFSKYWIFFSAAASAEIWSKMFSKQNVTFFRSNKKKQKKGKEIPIVIVNLLIHFTPFSHLKLKLIFSFNLVPADSKISLDVVVASLWILSPLPQQDTTRFSTRSQGLVQGNNKV